MPGRNERLSLVNHEDYGTPVVSKQGADFLLVAVRHGNACHVDDGSGIGCNILILVGCDAKTVVHGDALLRRASVGSDMQALQTNPIGNVGGIIGSLYLLRLHLFLHYRVCNGEQRCVGQGTYSLETWHAVLHYILARYLASHVLVAGKGHIGIDAIEAHGTRTVAHIGFLRIARAVHTEHTRHTAPVAVGQAERGTAATLQCFKLLNAVHREYRLLRLGSRIGDDDTLDVVRCSCGEGYRMGGRAVVGPFHATELSRTDRTTQCPCEDDSRNMLSFGYAEGNAATFLIESQFGVAFSIPYARRRTSIGTRHTDTAHSIGRFFQIRRLAWVRLSNSQGF